MKKLLRSVPCAVDKEKFKHTYDISEFPYRITIRYNYKQWNELCAQTVEQFGLPGNRFTVSSKHGGIMTFLFKSEQDLLFFKLKWSEYELSEYELSEYEL